MSLIRTRIREDQKENAIQEIIIQAQDTLEVVRDIDQGMYSTAIGNYVEKLQEHLDTPNIQFGDSTYQSISTLITNIAALSFFAEHNLGRAKVEDADDSQQTIRVTNHARRRMKERVKIPARACVRQAEKAYQDGISYPSTQGNSKEVKIYENFAYVFKGRSLVTVLPLDNGVPV